MPVLHWPTFSQQLVAREDERSDSWRAFVLSLGERSDTCSDGLGLFMQWRTLSFSYLAPPYRSST
jgi:hypothetical protein